MIDGLKPMIRIKFELLVDTTIHTPIYVDLFNITDKGHEIKWTRFNNYEVVFRGENITWDVNGIVVNRAKFPIPSNVNIKAFDNPIFKIKEILIYLDVDDKSLDKHQLNLKCPTLIIDHFLTHFRRESQKNENIPHLHWEVYLANDICTKIKNEKLILKEKLLKFTTHRIDNKLIKQYNFEEPFLNKEELIFGEGFGYKHKKLNYTIENGILKLAKCNGQYYSRSEVATKATFKLGRIEIRAKRAKHFFFMTDFLLRPQKSNLGTGLIGMKLFDLENGSWMFSKIENGRVNVGNKSDISKINPDEFHTFGFELNDDYINWFIDDRVVYKVSKIDINVKFDYWKIFDEDYKLSLIFGERYLETFKWKDVSHLNRDWLEVESIKIYGD